MITVEDFYDKFADYLGLKLVAGDQGLSRKIQLPEAHRPGLALAGYMEYHAKKRIIILGKVEIKYLQGLKTTVCKNRLKGLFTKELPAIILARGYKPIKELQELCEKLKVPLFRTSMSTMRLTSRLQHKLSKQFAPKQTIHATMVEVFGVGVLIKGDSAVGKSEAALGLIERGHRLVSDDLVLIQKLEGGALEGSGPGFSNYHMEIRGIGIINVANLYGAVCINEKKKIDIVVCLENWDSSKEYVRLGDKEETCKILDVKVPYHELPVKPGRDVVLLLETLALNFRLKKMGYHSALELKKKLQEKIASKSAKRGVYSE
ncbi:MAG: HPr kinase/phosphorylase [Chlamydiales bacterium]|nr:HPr(Ser) kinase/phosphatase [Chlamydiales bacterium]NCF70158.1 HPr kinase/phosphorylase [Chlamydiales bacterium]